MPGFNKKTAILLSGLFAYAANIFANVDAFMVSNNIVMSTKKFKLDGSSMTARNKASLSFTDSFELSGGASIDAGVLCINKHHIGGGNQEPIKLEISDYFAARGAILTQANNDRINLSGTFSLNSTDIQDLDYVTRSSYECKLNNVKYC